MKRTFSGVRANVCVRCTAVVVVVLILYLTQLLLPPPPPPPPPQQPQSGTSPEPSPDVPPVISSLPADDAVHITVELLDAVQPTHYQRHMGTNWTGLLFGDSECSGKGWRVGGVAPYCECHTGYSGSTCDKDVARTNEHKKLNACVAFLVLGELKFAEELVDTLQYLDTYFNDHYHYPVVVFHTKKFATEKVESSGDGCNTSATYLDLIRAGTRSTVIFEEVSVDFPDSIKRKYGSKGPKSTCNLRQWSLDYYHMCRFFTYLVFRTKAFRDFDYVWRLDGNSALAVPITCDPFQVMLHSNSIFGFYRYDKGENPKCMGDIHGFAMRYAEKHTFKAQHLDRVGVDVKGPTHYLGAWGVFKTSFFTSESFLDFAQKVDEYGFVYLHRLGEQVLLAHSLALLAPVQSIHQYGGFSPLMHRHLPLWPYEEYGTIRHDPICEALRDTHPWEAPPQNIFPAEYGERFLTSDERKKLWEAEKGRSKRQQGKQKHCVK